MVKNSNHRYDQLVVAAAYLLLAIVIWLAVMSEFRLDDSFITYRYARNFANGLGLVYNPGDSVLSTTAPLYAMLLAVLSFFIHDFHFLGSLIGTLCIGLGGWLIYALLPPRMHFSIRLWGGVIYVLSSPLWLALGMETSLWLMLVLAAVNLARLNRWHFAGLLVGLAVLTRPDAALPAVLLFLAAFGISINRSHTMRRWWIPIVYFTAAAAIPILIFAACAFLTYGSPFPATLSAKSAQAVLGITGLGVKVDTWEGLNLILSSLLLQSSLYISLALLVVFGLAGSLSASVLMVVLWGGLHVLAYGVLRVAPYRWYYAPLVPGTVLLAVCGLYFIQQRLQRRSLWLANGVIAAIAIFPLIAQVSSFSRITDMVRKGGSFDVMLPIVDWKVYRDTGEWLESHTAPDARIGVAEVGQIGFYANRWMTDYLGLLQPDVAAMLKRGDLYSWLADYAPDYLVFQRFRGAKLVLYNYVIQDDPWFNNTYQQIAEFDDPRYASGPVVIFQRVPSLRPLNPQSVQLDFGGLRLVGLVSDADSLTTQGGSVRVRLDWEVTGELPPDLHIAVKGVDMAGTNPAFDGDYHTADWRGTFSTWHGFVVPEGVEPGDYTLLVSVGPRGGPYHEQWAGLLHVVSS